MTGIGDKKSGERGNILLVVVFLATAIAGLAAISSGRVVSESRLQTALEGETRAYNSAYAQLHLAMNVVNTSAYDDGNQIKTTDFREVYATLIEEWMGYHDSKAILKGEFPTLGLFA